MSDFYIIDGRWYHGPWWKRAINPVLRALQFWTDRPYVIYSRASEYLVADPARPPELHGYGFGRVRTLPRLRYRIARDRR